MSRDKCPLRIRGVSKVTLRLSYCKWFSGPFSSIEAPRLASLSRIVGKSNPLKENKGERWFHADWDA